MRLALQRRAAKQRVRRIVSVRKSPLDPLRAQVRFGSLVFPAALGRGGIRLFKREGDGATPRAAMEVLGGFQKSEPRRMIVSRIPLRRVGKRDGWCDAPTHAAYNRPVRLPFGFSHETLTRSDSLYDAALILDWNVSRRVRGAGSAIFLHVARDGFPPTEGCIALREVDLQRLLKVIRRRDIVRVM